MEQHKEESFNELIDIIDGSEQKDDVGLRHFLGTKEGREALYDFQTIDCAIERKWGMKINPDAVWERMSFNTNDRKHNEARIRAIVLTLSTVAAVVLVLWLIISAKNITGFGERGKVVEALPKPSISCDGFARINSKASKQEENQSVALNKISTLDREIKHLRLSDGSEVWLNAKSSLSYPLRFSSSERKVNLKGEAYFKIAHDPKHPFIVASGNLRTRVLGTEFNVRCYNDQDAHVTLVKGSVEVSTEKAMICVKPGEDAHVSEESITVMPVNTKDYVSWRTGTMYFDNASLRTILNEMGNWYGVNIVCHDKGLLDKRFHFMYNHTLPIEDALSLLNDASDINIILENNTIVIK